MVGHGHLAALEQQRDAPGVRRHRQLHVAHPLRQRVDLARPRQRALGRVRIPGGQVGVREHEGERGRVAHPARHRDRLLGQRLAAVGRRRPVEGGGQPREQPRAQCAVGLGQLLERLFQQRDQALLVGQSRGQAPGRRCQRRVGQQLHVTGAAGGVGGRAERPAPGVEAPGAHLGLAHRQQDRGAAPGVLAGQVEHAEGGAEQLDRLLVGHRLQRVLPRPHRVDRRAGRVDRGRRLEEVIGKLAVRDVRPVTVELDEGLAHGHVQSDPLVSGQVVVERLPDQRVREAIAADLARALLHEPRLARRVEVLEQLRPLLGDHSRERLQGELRADHGGGGQHIDGLLRQRIEPAADRLAHPVGHAAAARRATR